jgi:predicted nucleic acid-binding protein
VSTTSTLDIVIDTNVVSEALRPSPAEQVIRWLDAQEPRVFWTTTVTQAEVLYGIELLPHGKRRTNLADGADRMFAKLFSGRILPFDEEAAHMYAKIVAARKALARPISYPDAMIAAIARSRNAVVATRNTKDFEHCGIRIVNPWNE